METNPLSKSRKTQAPKVLSSRRRQLCARTIGTSTRQQDLAGEEHPPMHPLEPRPRTPFAPACMTVAFYSPPEPSARLTTCEHGEGRAHHELPARGRSLTGPVGTQSRPSRGPGWGGGDCCSSRSTRWPVYDAARGPAGRLDRLGLVVSGQETVVQYIARGGHDQATGLEDISTCLRLGLRDHEALDSPHSLSPAKTWGSKDVGDICIYVCTFL